jgi:hypothetical protein
MRVPSLFQFEYFKPMILAESFAVPKSVRKVLECRKPSGRCGRSIGAVCVDQLGRNRSGLFTNSIPFTDSDRFTHSPIWTHSSIRILSPTLSFGPIPRRLSLSPPRPDPRHGHIRQAHPSVGSSNCATVARNARKQGARAKEKGRGWAAQPGTVHLAWEKRR